MFDRDIMYSLMAIDIKIYLKWYFHTEVGIMNTTQKSKDMFLKRERVDLDNDEEYEQNRYQYRYANFNIFILFILEKIQPITELDKSCLVHQAIAHHPSKLMSPR